MTKFFIAFILCFTASMTMQIQAQEATQDEIAGIRAAYSAAKEQMELNSHADEMNVPRSDMEISSHYIIPGSGPTEDVIHYYFTMDDDPETGSYVYKPYLVTRSFNIAAHQFYQEYLIDKESRLLFFFQSQSNDAIEGGTAETRFYYGKHGVHKAVKGDATLDEELCIRSAQELISAFGLIMNNDY